MIGTLTTVTRNICVYHPQRSTANEDANLMEILHNGHTLLIISGEMGSELGFNPFSLADAN